MTAHVRRLPSLLVPAALVAAFVLAPARADAGLGARDGRNWSWVDSKGTSGPVVIPRYATVPVKTATGDGTLTQPRLPERLWDYTTGAPTIPVETWTLTATSATTFTVVGSVSGTLAVATVGTDYTTSPGMNFQINAGSTPFVAGDTFVFAVVARLDPSTVPGATSRTISPLGYAMLPLDFQLYLPGYGTSGAIVAYDAGYVALTGRNQPAILEDFYPRKLPNVALPARVLTNDSFATAMPFWDELQPKATSKVWSATLGRDGERAYVIEYNDFAHQGDPTASYTFQIVFFENREQVRFHYVRMQNGTATSANGSTATIGLQGDLGRTYTATSYAANTGAVMDGLTIEFGIDSDGDRLPGRIELAYGTSDGSRFSDGGTLTDTAQLLAGLNPTTSGDNATLTTDTDADGILDAEETVLGTNPAVKDTDADGLEDNAELTAGNRTDPLLADSDGDGRSDGQEDADKSGNVNGTETNPRAWDSDNDGVNDGTEVAQGTDPLLDTSARLSSLLTVPGSGQIYNVASALDAKGNVHLTWTGSANRNNVADDLWVALLTPGSSGYAIAVAPTRIEAHVGMDDRAATIVTLPGAAGSTVDRTFLVNGTTGGYAFLTELDFGAATRDGSASTSATLVKTARMLSLPVGVDQPTVTVAGGKFHVVFQGQALIGGGRFAKNQAVRGSYYVGLEVTGDVAVGPIKLYEADAPGHHHNRPRIAVDAMGNIHSVIRGGSCRWSQGPVGCALYYTKLSSTGAALIPTTKLQLEGGGFHRYPAIAISPNGLVNVVYTTNAPVISGNGDGGYTVGSEVRLQTFATTNNQITTVIDQKPLFSAKPDLTNGMDVDGDIAAYRTPALALDAGGNIHLFVVEDNNLRAGLYAAFDPKGDRKVGPYTLVSAYNWGTDAIQATSTAALISYKSGSQVRFRAVDLTGSGLDLTGASQPPLPTVAAPTLTAIAPDAVAIGGSAVVTLTGTGFVSGATATIGGVALTGITVVDATRLIGTIDASALAEGVHDVAVQNPDAAMATLPAAFYVGVRPTVEPEPEPPVSDDGGCCDVRGASPVGSLLLTAIVLAGLGRRRRLAPRA